MGDHSRPWITREIVKFGTANGCNPDDGTPRHFVTLEGTSMHDCVWTCRHTLSGIRPHGFDNKRWTGVAGIRPIRGLGAADKRRAKAVGLSTHAFIMWDGRSAGAGELIDMVEKKGIPFVVHIVPKGTLLNWSKPEE